MNRYIEYALPDSWAAIIATQEDEAARNYCITAAAVLLRKESFAPHSGVIQKIIGQKSYTAYLDTMDKLMKAHGGWRNDDFQPGKYCKRWHLQDPHNIKGGLLPGPLSGPSSAPAGVVVVRVLASFVDAIRCAVRSFVDSFVGGCEAVCDVVSLSVAGFTVEPFDPADVLDYCDGSEESAAPALAILSGIAAGGGGLPPPHICPGGRVYHGLTTLPSGLRGLLRQDGEPLVELDLHASYPSIIAGIFAQGSERDRLIEGVQSGCFYDLMGGLAGVDGVSAKLGFMEALFSYKAYSHNHLWQAFELEFPRTARSISLIRDSSDVIVKRRVNGPSTRAGQRELSRRLNRVESHIFLHLAMMRLWKQHGVRCLSIHDCLAVTPQNVDLAKREIERAAEEVLGFLPFVKVKPARTFCR